jgi:hypothetical protein
LNPRAPAFDPSAESRQGGVNDPNRRGQGDVRDRALPVREGGNPGPALGQELESEREVVCGEDHGCADFDVNFIEDPENVTMYFINEVNLRGCPHAKMTTGDKEIIALLDSGAEVSVMSEELFNSLLERELKFLHIPVTNCVLSSAWLSKSKRIKK